MNYILVDGNNMALRGSFAHDGLKNFCNIPTGVHYGMMHSIFNTVKAYPSYKMIIAWDSKSLRRINESQKFVEKSVIPSGYKANREKQKMQPVVNFIEQAPFLKRAINELGIVQVNVADFEADDVLGTYSRWLAGNGHKVVLLTSDKDYYQLLDDNIEIFDAMKKKTFYKDTFFETYGIQPRRWVDVGAIAGDDGDNIFGVPGWGDKTAIKEIINYGTCFGVVEHYEKEYGSMRKRYPDLNKLDDKENALKIFNEKINGALSEKGEKTEANKRTDNCYKYPCAYFDMPWTGVAIAFENNEIKIPKRILSLLMYQERMRLAYSLKNMDMIEELPDIENISITGDKMKMLEYIDFYEMYSLNDEVELYFDTKNNGE